MSYDQLWGTNYFQATITAMTYPLTIVVWIKKSESQWDAGGADYVLNLSDNFTDDDQQIRIYSGGHDVTGVWTTTGTASSGMDFTDDIYNDVWVPVISLYTSNVSKRIYIEDSSSAGNLNTQDRDISGLDSFRLGRLMASFGGFEGKIAEVSIWDDALDTSEIDLLNPTAGEGPAAPTIDTSTSGATCVGYWPLDYDSATQTDESGQANGSFIEVGTTVYDSDHPTITSDTIVQQAMHHYRHHGKIF